jgi:hypothetical protein
MNAPKRLAFGSPSFGHAQLLPMTSDFTSSGLRPATPRPIGPPQSCAINVTFDSFSASKNCSTDWLCVRGRKS